MPATERSSGAHAWLDEIIDSLEPEERLILPVLQAIQRHLTYVPENAADAVAQLLNVSRAEVVGVLTYYHDLRTSPPPRVVVRICEAEACQSVGSRELKQTCTERWATESQSDIEISTVYCFGNCALGPAAQVNGRLIGKLDFEQLERAVSEELSVRKQ